MTCACCGIEKVENENIMLCEKCVATITHLGAGQSTPEKYFTDEERRGEWTRCSPERSGESRS